MNKQPPAPGSAGAQLGWALWRRDAEACRSLGASEPDPLRSAQILAIAEALAGKAPVPPRLMTAESGVELGLAMLHCSLLGRMAACDDFGALRTVERMQALDRPDLPAVMRALVARGLALCAQVAETPRLLVDRAVALLALPEVMDDPRLRIGLTGILVRALAGVDPARSTGLLERLRTESPADLRAAGCDLRQAEVEHLFFTGSYPALIRELERPASARQAFLEHPLLPYYLMALGAELRLDELGAWIGDWRRLLERQDAHAPAVRARRNVLQGVAFMHGMIRRDFALARAMLRERCADLEPGRDTPPRFLNSALDIELAERSTRHARALLERLDPAGTSHQLALRWCRLHLQEGDLTEAARRFRAVEDGEGIGPRRIELAMATDLDAPRMLELLAEVRRQREPSAPARTVSAVQAAEPTLVGHSRAMHAVREAIGRFAGLQQPVLIVGETGTGKEVIARALHAASPRSTAPFVPLNCAAVPDSLAEGELFGHAAGAFTGATEMRAGIIEAAGGGTVFLDEVASMPMRLQGVLLRLLESGEYRRVGDTRLRQTEARFIFASNEELEDAVADGRFREDLMYRLRRFVIHAPPLRDHPEDIPDLCCHFIRRCIGNDRVLPGPELLRRLQMHSWPGNVRELRNEIERLAVLHPHAAALPPGGFSPRGLRGAGMAPASEMPGTGDLEGLPATRSRRQRILGLIDRHGRVHRADVVKAIACSPATATRDLQALLDAGLVRRIETSGNLRTSYFVRSGPG